MVVNISRTATPPGIIFLMGPTASGKTSTATTLFDQINCELISVDAAQVFRGMNIGTAKPTDSFLTQYPHHLIDIRNINQSYSAAEFCEDARNLINAIQGRGNTPVFVGGTMFYFSALENGISDLPAADSEIRKSLVQELAQTGLSKMYQQLVDIDPDMMNRLSATDSQRIQRALEIHRITGRPPSEVMRESTAQKLPFPIIKLALFTADRKQLHRQIEQRFTEMLDQGLVEEVTSIVSQHDDIASFSSMRTVGYRQVIAHINGQTAYQEMIESACAATRQLAKRQLTWLRNQSNVTWFDANHPACEPAILQYLQCHHFL